MTSARPKTCQPSRQNAHRNKKRRKTIKKPKRAKKLKSKSARYKTVQPNGTSRPHVLKTQGQWEALMTEWQQSQTFSTARIRAIATSLGLPNRKVYKWVYDR